MAETTWAQRLGVTPGRMLLIAVLGVVLVLALLARPKPPAAPPRTPKPPIAARVTSSAPADRREPARPWPDFPLEQVVQYDPFSLPPSLRGLGLGERLQQEVTVPVAAAVDDDASERVEALRQRGVGLVLITEDGAVATIGGETVRPGDVIDGFRVVKIDTTGVFLTDEGATEP